MTLGWGAAAAGQTAATSSTSPQAITQPQAITPPQAPAPPQAPGPVKVRRNTSRAASDAAPTPVEPPQLPGMPQPAGTQVDRVVAIVNGELILDSDINQDMRLEELEPYGQDEVAPNDPRHLGAGDRARSAALSRLINRDLILEQIRLQPQDDVPKVAVDQQIAALRRNIPECTADHCETDAGWTQFLAQRGFTPASLRQLWTERMQVLAFIEQRFRMGIKISPEQIADYYNQSLLPQYRALHAQAPPLQAISDRIQEVLLEQQVTNLLSDWLQNLRAQGHVVLLHPGEAAP